jgi:hypothetical protein
MRTEGKYFATQFSVLVGVFQKEGCSCCSRTFISHMPMV